MRPGLEEAEALAAATIEERRAALDRIADRLLEREEMTGDDVLELLEAA